TAVGGLSVTSKEPMSRVYNSALFVGPEPILPPAISTFPFDSNVAVCWSRGVFIRLVVATQSRNPGLGLYTSALLPMASPPAARTNPFVSNVVVKARRGVVIGPVGDQVPLAGLNNSALATIMPLVS